MPDDAMTRTRPLAAQVGLLAWRRTALEVGVVSVIAARVFAKEASAWAVVLGLAGVVLALAVHASASRAYRDGDDYGHHALGRNAALTAFVIVVGIAALWWVMASA
jgi:hypothetical protein